MSDTHSVPLSPGYHQPTVTAGAFVDANAVLQRVLQQVSPEDRSRIILRCDELPFLRGSEEDLHTVFTGLIQFILQNKEAVPKLFLHIHCSVANNPSPAARGEQQYMIQFNTNLSHCFNRMQANELQFAAIAALLRRNNGHLVVNQVKASGSIFSVSLPGKTH